jgi:hypothetical protein
LPVFFLVVSEWKRVVLSNRLAKRENSPFLLQFPSAKSCALSNYAPGGGVAKKKHVSFAIAADLSHVCLHVSAATPWTGSGAFSCKIKREGQVKNLYRFPEGFLLANTKRWTETSPRLHWRISGRSWRFGRKASQRNNLRTAKRTAYWRRFSEQIYI